MPFLTTTHDHLNMTYSYKLTGAGAESSTMYASPTLFTSCNGCIRMHPPAALQYNTVVALICCGPLPGALLSIQERTWRVCGL
jgi:hypothetical protein